MSEILTFSDEVQSQGQINISCHEGKLRCLILFQPPPPQPPVYDFPIKRILLTRDPKDRSVKGTLRQPQKGKLVLKDIVMTHWPFIIMCGFLPMH